MFGMSLTQIAGSLIVIFGFLGLGKNRKSNQFIIKFIGVTGFRILVMTIGFIIIFLDYYGILG